MLTAPPRPAPLGPPPPHRRSRNRRDPIAASIRRPTGARLAVLAIGRRKLPIFGVDAGADRALKQLFHRELLKLGQRTAPTASSSPRASGSSTLRALPLVLMVRLW